MKKRIICAIIATQAIYTFFEADMKSEIDIKYIGNYILTVLKWLFISVLVGGICGAVGAAFARAVTFATELRGEHWWILLLLPVLGLGSVLIYKLLCVKGIGTDKILEGATTDEKVPFRLSFAVFAASVLTHLGGGSAGREGAALQLGGSIAGGLSSLFRLSPKDRRVLTMCAMGAVFSAVFGTPVGAAVFALEVCFVGKVGIYGIFPAIISSVAAYGVSTLLGTKPEHFELERVLSFDLPSILKVLLIAVVCALGSIAFCTLLRLFEKIFKRLFKNEFLRIFVGGAVIVLLTVVLRTGDYNGGGIEVIERIFSHGEVRYEAFLLKMIFTAITVAAGYKGGEIIPSFFIGATLGGSLAVLLGISPAFGAAVGMAALFCGVTNCPFATIFLCVEMFGAEGLIFFALSVATSFIISGKYSLYHSQRFAFSKLCEK